MTQVKVYNGNKKHFKLTGKFSHKVNKVVSYIDCYDLHLSDACLSSGFLLSDIDKCIQSTPI